MDSFEFNKVAGAVLGTALLVMALSIVADIIYEPPEAEKPGYVIAVATGPTDTTDVSTGPAETPIAVRLQTADAAAGEKTAAVCKTCHTFEKVIPRPTPGPNLWNVVGGPIAHLQGFSYSDALMALHDKGETWTYDNLDHFLTSPKAFAPGTAMTFLGIKKPDQRANVIAYLRTLSDSPLPLPEPTASAPAEAPAAAAEAPAAAPADVPAK